MAIKLGLIQGILSQELKTNYWPTVTRLAELGYQALELYTPSPDESQPDTLKRLQDMGLPIIGSATNPAALEKDPAAVAAAALAVGAKYVMIYWLPVNESMDQLRRMAAFLDQVGGKLAAHGLKLCFHNHGQEFTNPLDGKSQLDLLLENTTPGHVHVELDMGWAMHVGADPVAFLNRWAGRVPVVHIKDFVSTAEPPQFTAVGTGILPLRATLEAVARTGVDWTMVEQDKPNHLTPMETVTASLLNIKELGFLSA